MTENGVQPLVAARDVTKVYRTPAHTLFGKRNRVHALAGVTLEVPRGQSVAIVGESGSGKTTLSRQLLGLSKPTSGEVAFDGRKVDPRTDDLVWLRRRTGLVFQDPYSSFNPRRTIGDSVAEPLESAAEPCSREEQLEMARAMLVRVGLPADAVDRLPRAFSGGQRQRIAIARALIHHPELLVGDEPVSALDVLVRAHVLELLAQLRAELGLTMITITHDLSIVPQLAERTVVMSNGLIVEDGPTAQILTQPEHPYTQELLAARLELPPTTWRG
ncbi:ABC transporter ATP-binding protein [Leucobacter sp. cx-328]|uniref:ABC transporter ATP-binding protein n=1 Tax=unclassified Leucobacter TaxID=2621730 RepID=UPI00165E3CDD|nr:MULTISPECIES: ATP-binding cassette domain-containing protein [unclassified Leucobacter]MBC9943358.1 ABC transporter ATP-binding protein [Leucobacter sp. cx-328]